MHANAPSPSPTDAPPRPSVLHLWFVEYNPLYLVSAALVLVGVVQIAGSLAQDVDTAARLGIAAIAELYAWSLIGGAALLVRLGRRRPATMLALLAALYQCDLTLHTEICALSAPIGLVGASAWLGGFGLKLVALARAMRLSLSRTAFVVPVLGATMSVVLPWVMRSVVPLTATTIVCSAWFVVLLLGLWTERRVHSRDALGAWPQLVKRRALRATWIGWAVMLCLHVGVWFVQSPWAFRGAPWIPLALLLSIRAVHRERWVWMLLAAALGLAVFEHPDLTTMVAVLAAITLAVRAHVRPAPTVSADVPSPGRDPYRHDDEPAPHLPRPRVTLVRECTAVRNRLLFAALGCTTLAIVTFGWHGGPLPLHRVGLELVLVVVAIAMTRALRTPSVLLWPALSLVHSAMQLGLVPVPQTRLQWGAASVGLGFVLLLLSLVVTVRSRAHASAGSDPPGRSVA